MNDSRVAVRMIRNSLVTDRGKGMLPSVADVLALPEIQYGRPELCAGGAHLGRPVRWAHVSELPDIASLLQGGELILTTGIALPESADDLRDYIAGLADVGAAGLIVELGRRFDTLPKPLVTSCHRHDLPLVALRREVRFVKVTEAVHSLIADEQFGFMGEALRAHEVFTSLCIDGASAIDIVSEAANLTGCPVIFENLMHQVLACESSGVPTDDLLRNWEARSRAASAAAAAGRSNPEGWAIVQVSARGVTWGRLILVYNDGEPAPLQMMIIERAAVALTLNRLLERSQETLERQAHRSTLSDIIEHRFRSTEEMQARTAALGIPTTNCQLVAIVVDIAPHKADHALSAAPHRRADENAELISAAVRAVGARALVGAINETRVGILLPVRALRERAPTLQKIALSVHRLIDDRHRATNDWLPGAAPVVLIGVGSSVSELTDVRRSFAEAGQVAEAAQACHESKLFYEIPDIQLEGLLYVLAEDPRVQAFVERTLGPLLEYDARQGTTLVDTLRIYLDRGRNKSAAADGAFLSRQALYQRLSSIERILDVDLSSANVCTSLHAAIMALPMQQRQSWPLPLPAVVHQLPPGRLRLAVAAAE